MTVRLPSIDHGKDDLARLCHTDGTARCTSITDVSRELLFARRHMHVPIRDEARPRADDLHSRIPHAAHILHQDSRIADACARRCKGIHCGAMNGNDIPIRRNCRIIGIDLRHTSLTNHIFQPVGICPRRSAVGTVINDETILPALGIDPRDGERDLIDLHCPIVGNRSENKGAVRHYAECTAVIIRRTDNHSVDLRHAEDRTVGCKVGGIDCRCRIGIACNAADGLPPRDDPARERLFLQNRQSLFRLLLSARRLCGLHRRRFQLCGRLFPAPCGYNIEEYAERLGQIPDPIVHPRRHGNGDVEMPAACGIGYSVNTLRPYGTASKCPRIRIRKIKGQLTPVLGEADMIDGHLRKVKDEAVALRRTRCTQVV